MKKKNCLDRLKWSSLAVFGLLFSFFLYGPLELYLTNKESVEFWFSFSELVLPLMFFMIIGFILIIGILMILPIKAYQITFAIIVAINVLMFVQATFLPNGYGALDGEQIKWDLYTFRFIYNSVIWIAVFVLVLLFSLKKWKNFRFIASYATILLILIQALSLTLLAVSKNEEKDAPSEISYLTKKNEYTVSSGNNTIVFVLDCFDSQLMCDLLEQYSNEFQQSFADFTFYHNTSGGATRTKYAIPFLLTKQINENSLSYEEYLKKSYQESPLFQELKTNEYNTGFYTDSMYLDRSQTKAIDNLSSETELHASSIWGLSSSMIKMTAFKYMPHALKPFFWMYSFELSQWKGGEKDNIAYTIDDVSFYEELKNQGLSFSDTQPAFRFFHLAGAHGPFVMDENMQRVSNGNKKMQGLGSLRIVAQYISLLKQIGVYENTNIFIMSDHGDTSYGVEDYEQNPLFMVKTAYSSHEFTISEIKITYKSFPNMLVDALNNSLNIEDHYQTSETRYFYSCDERNNTINIVEYASDGEAYDVSSWYKTGNIFKSENLDYKYVLGTKLYCGELYGATAKKYYVKGFTLQEGNYVWTAEKEIELAFDIGNIEQNLLLTFDYSNVYNIYQRCYVYIADHLIGSFIANQPASKSFIIPKEYVQDGLLSVKMKLPDAISPLAEGSGADERELGISFVSFMIDKSDQPYDSEKQMTITEYVLGNKIVFGPEGNMEQFHITGISKDKWTASKKVSFSFDNVFTKKDLEFIITYKALTGQQHVIVFANGNQVADYIATNAEEKTIIIPNTYINNGLLKIELELPDAAKPSNGDPRELALLMEEVVLQEIP